MELDDSKLEAKLLKYFPRKALTKQPIQERLSPRNLQYAQSHLLRFDNILDHNKLIVIKAFVLNRSSSTIDEFLVNLDNGVVPDQDLLDQLCKALPTHTETQRFKERLYEYNIESFHELGNLPKPLMLRKLSREEEFII